jgi:hypothetical protein
MTVPPRAENRAMFEGLERFRVDVERVTLAGRRGASGPPPLRGHPQQPAAPLAEAFDSFSQEIA